MSVALAPEIEMKLAGVAAVALAGSPFAKPRLWKHAVVRVELGNMPRAVARATFIGEAKANALDALARETLARRVEPGHVLLFILGDGETFATATILDLDLATALRRHETSLRRAAAPSKAPEDATTPALAAPVSSCGQGPITAPEAPALDTTEDDMPTNESPGVTNPATHPATSTPATHIPGAPADPTAPVTWVGTEPGDHERPGVPAAPPPAPPEEP